MKGLTAAIFSILMGCANPACAFEPLRFTTEYSPPFNFTDDKGQVVGVSTDALRAMAERAGVPITVELMSWPRAYNEALTKPDACVYSTAMVESRIGLFQWVGPLARNDWVVFGRADDPNPPQTIEALKGKRIAVYQGDVKETFFKNMPGYVLDSAPRDELNALKLSTGRVDYWVSGAMSGASYVQRSRITNIKRLFGFRDVELALACNKQVAPDAISALSAALLALRREGALTRIEEKYLLSK
jgi:polar amino acid transport system substrate-binding protein